MELSNVTLPVGFSGGLDKGENRYVVFYSKDFSASCMGDQEVDASLPGILNTHALLFVVRGESLNEVYMKMQGENWSPNGEARELIRGQGLKHTSMSVGDILLSEQYGIFYRCTMSGWEKL